MFVRTDCEWKEGKISVVGVGPPASKKGLQANGEHTGKKICFPDQQAADSNPLPPGSQTREIKGGEQRQRRSPLSIPMTEAEDLILIVPVQQSHHASYILIDEERKSEKQQAASEERPLAPSPLYTRIEEPLGAITKPLYIIFQPGKIDIQGCDHGSSIVWVTIIYPALSNLTIRTKIGVRIVPRRKKSLMVGLVV